MCDCNQQMTSALKEHNANLDIPMTISGHGSKVVIKTRKRDSKKRGSLPLLFATYCPFCGEKYVQ